MATLKLYQMYDNVAMLVAGPIIAGNRDEAVIRQFTDVLARPDTQPGQYPNDFSLLQIGEQNQDTGELTAMEPRIIYTGRVWLRLKGPGSSPANTAGETTPVPLQDNNKPDFSMREYQEYQAGTATREATARIQNWLNSTKD